MSKEPVKLVECPRDAWQGLPRQIPTELKVSYLRGVTASSGPLTAVGTVVKPGRRVAFAEGEVRDAAGSVVATASSSLLVFPIPT